MEEDKLNESSISSNKKQIKNNYKKYFGSILIIIFNSIIIILLLLYIIYLKKIINELKKKIKNKKFHNKKEKEIIFIKKMFQLYVENRTEYYIKGRQRVMELRGKTYNDSNITTIQDKLNWLIIHEFPENKSNIVDKILLHEYSKKILGKDICVPIIKIYNNIEEINLNDLPNKFALKCNHGSKFNILCNNKSNFNLTKAKKKLAKWMKINYGLENFEYQYINIKRKIFVEKYLMDNINNYKFNCYNGEPKFIRVTKDLPNKSGKINNYYTLNWTLNELETNADNYIRRPDYIFEKPKNFNLMLEYAKKLSANFVFVRVDFYEINDNIYLSELTFTPFNILMNYKDGNQSIYLGKLLNITNIKNTKFRN